MRRAVPVKKWKIFSPNVKPKDKVKTIWMKYVGEVKHSYTEVQMRQFRTCLTKMQSDLTELTDKKILQRMKEMKAKWKLKPEANECAQKKCPDLENVF